MKNFLMILCAVMLVFWGVVTSPLSAAPIANGSFELGFSAWETFNLADIKDATYGVNPSNGTNYAQILAESGDDAINAGALETFLGVSDATLQAIKSGFTDFTEGSAIKQSFTATAGSIISFDWKFLTDEDIPSPYDFAFYTVNSDAFALADTNIDSGFITSATPLGLETTDWRANTFIVPTTGTYTLGFGVLQAYDYSISSALLIDDVKGGAAPVPESSTILLLGLGLIGMVGYGRKRFSKRG